MVSVSIGIKLGKIPQKILGPLSQYGTGIVLPIINGVGMIVETMKMIMAN